MDKVKEVIAKVTHKDGSHHDSAHAHETTHGSHTTGTGIGSGNSNTAGLNSSNPVNNHHNTHTGQPSVTDKLNPMVDSDRDGKTNFGLAKEGPGAHNNHQTTHTGKPSVTDKLNPMVDSDRDGKTNVGLAKEGPGAHNNHQTAHTGQPSLVQKLNPMVDSDRDGKSNFGLAKEGPGAHNTHSNTTGVGATGPHSSQLANQADPRIDSSNYGNAQSTGTGTGANTYGQSTNSGPHSSNIANKLDPRVDQSNYGHNSGGLSSTDGQNGGFTGSSHQPLTDTQNHGGFGQQNASGIPGNQNTGYSDGPHNSSMLNKLDPRVSERDGNQTM